MTRKPHITAALCLALLLTACPGGSNNNNARALIPPTIASAPQPRPDVNP